MFTTQIQCDEDRASDDAEKYTSGFSSSRQNRRRRLAPFGPAPDASATRVSPEGVIRLAS